MLRRGDNFASIIMQSIDKACEKGIVIALHRVRVLTNNIFVRKELGKAIKNNLLQESHSILPFYLVKGLSEKVKWIAYYFHF